MSDTLLTQEEIDALLSGASGGGSGDSGSTSGGDSGDGGGGSDVFSSEEKEALKEFFVLLSNGAASVLLTLSNDENAKCEFSELKTDSLGTISGEINGSSMLEMNFNEGFEFKSNVFIAQTFIKSIASMMLGGAEVEELAPEFVSAAEAFFDQIFGSVVMLWKNRYDIAARYIPPQIITESDPNALGLPDEVVSIKFNISLNENDSSNLFILFPVEDAKKLLTKIMSKSSTQELEETSTAVSSDGELSQDEIDKMLAGGGDDSMEEPAPMEMGANDSGSDYDDEDDYEDEDDYYEEEVRRPPARKKKKKSGNGIPRKTRSFGNENINSVNFGDLDEEELVELPSNIDLLLDVPLEITVELGRTKQLVKDILELGTGSVIELDRLAGESIDVLVNGKLIAKGEVVVIDENFGIRITSIVSPNERLSKIK